MIAKETGASAAKANQTIDEILMARYIFSDGCVAIMEKVEFLMAGGEKENEIKSNSLQNVIVWHSLYDGCENRPAIVMSSLTNWIHHLVTFFQFHPT